MRSIDGAGVWTTLMQSKVQVLLGPQDRPFERGSLLKFINGFRKCPRSVQTAVFKTILNSWSTTYRLQEAILLPCIFGCEGCKDELQHYLTCPILWTIATSSASLPAPFLSLSPREKICLFTPSESGFRLLSLAYRGYHAMKLGHRRLIEECINKNEFSAVQLALCETCRDI